MIIEKRLHNLVQEVLDPGNLGKKLRFVIGEMTQEPGVFFRSVRDAVVPGQFVEKGLVRILPTRELLKCLL